MKKIIFILAFVFCAAQSRAVTDVWVTQAGGGDGSTTNLPLSQNQVNALTGTISDTTFHLCNTFTNGFDPAFFAGTAGHPVTFFFEPNAKLSAPAWGQWQGPLDCNHANSFSNGSPFRLDNAVNVIIDGGTNGLVEATANGAGFLQWSNRCDGLVFNLSGGSLEIKNLTITNLYQRNEGSKDAFTPGHANDPVYIVGGQGIVIGGGFTNSSIHNCNIGGTANLIAFSYTLDTHNVQVYSNNLSHCSFGIQVYGSYQAQGDGWQIWANTINIGTNWSGNNSFFHGDAIICNQHQGNYLLFDPSTTVSNYNGSGTMKISVPQFGKYGSYYNYFQGGDTNNVSITDGTSNYLVTSTWFAQTNFFTLHGTPGHDVTATVNWLHGATNVNMQIYRNYFGPTWGTNASAWIGVYADMPSGFQNYKIYNNVLAIDNVSSQSLMGNSLSCSDGALIANNTLVQINPVPIGVGMTAGFGGAKVYNNLAYNFDKAVSFNTANTDTRGWGWFANIDYNVYYGISEWDSGQGAWPSLFYNTNATIFYPAYTAVYRQQDGYETHSVINKPLISLVNFAPLTNDTVLIGKGLNLTSLGITNDFYGNPRPATGMWNIGSFQVTTNIVAAAPTFTMQPADDTGLTNSVLTASAVAMGDAPLKYSSYLNGVFNGFTNSISISSGLGSKTWFVIASNSTDKATSGTAELSWTNGVTGGGGGAQKQNNFNVLNVQNLILQ